MTPALPQRDRTQSAIAVILGGGRGTRLWPLTKYRAKPAVPIAGKYRLIDIPISICLNSGIDQIYVLTQFNSSSLNQHISEAYQLGPFSQGFVALEAASQQTESEDWYQGTADAVRRNLKMINQWHTEHVVILPGDTMFRMDLGEMLQMHIDKGADVTISLHPTDARRASSFGILNIEDDDRIVRMVEKPSGDKLKGLECSQAIMDKWGMKEEKPYLASMGIYIFRREVLAEMVRDASMTDFGHHILPTAVQDKKVYGYVFPHFWEDIGTIEAFFNINLTLVQPNPPFVFFSQGAPIYTRRRFLPSTKVRDVRMRHATIAEGCRIADGAELDTCMIGLRSVIGENVKMSEVVMMGADYYEHGYIVSGYEDAPDDAPLMGVGNNSEIRRAIIDKNARIGDNCRILNQEGRSDYDDPEERYYIRDGIVIIPKHGIIPAGTTI